MDDDSLDYDFYNDLDDLEMQVVRYKPEGLGSLCKNTKFSRKELQIMYRGFKQECPTGIVNEEGFKEIYAQFFPQGDSSSYAHFVFKTFDVDNNGSLSFEEFVTGLSVLSRGNINDRLQWAFNLYDINGDGIVTRDEMLQIVTAIYDMMGKHSEPVVDETTARSHVDNVFQKMDLNHDGVITYDEFIESCRKDKNIMNGLVISDTALCVGDSMPNSPASADTRIPLLPAQFSIAGQQMNPLTPPGAGFHNNNIQDTLVPMT